MRTQQPKLTDLLQSASEQQLVDLVLALNDEEQGLAERVAELLPPPDLSGIKDEVGRAGCGAALPALGGHV